MDGSDGWSPEPLEAGSLRHTGAISTECSHEEWVCPDPLTTFGFWFWVLMALAVILVGAFVYDVYDRRRKGVSTEFSEIAPAAGGEAQTLASGTQHRNFLNNGGL